MGLYEQLSLSFPEEQTVFGTCLLIPTTAFKPEWESQLKAEGVKVFQQSYNGRMFFFLKKPNSNSQSDSQTPQAPPSQPELKPLVWNEQTFKLVEDMRERGLSYKSIVEKFAEMGFKTSATTVLRKMKMRENDPKPTAKANCQGSDGLFREILEGASVLYEKRLKRACALLLRQASNMIEQL